MQSHQGVITWEEKQDSVFKGQGNQEDRVPPDPEGGRVPVGLSGVPSTLPEVGTGPPVPQTCSSEA